MNTTTKRLLACGVIGGPLFVVVGLAQALTRHGFDLAHQSLSMLSFGSVGWIQTTTFLIAGRLGLACATGVRRALRGRPGGVWVPRLLYVYGAGLIAGGLCHPDPGDGFPPPARRQARASSAAGTECCTSPVVRLRSSH